MSGMMGIGFQGSRLGRLPEWGKSDETTRVIRIAMMNLGVPGEGAADARK